MSVVGVRREAVGAQCMTASAVNAAKSMEPTGSAVNAAKSMEPTSAKSMKPTATTASAKSMKPAATTRPGDGSDVRHHAKRAHRNARCQNAYCFLLHDALPTWMS